MKLEQLSVTPAQLADFCRRWEVRELALFGSVLRDDFGPKSDVDVLVDFSPNAQWSLFDHVQMQDELSELFRRDVDLVTKKGLERSRNAVRRQAILEGARVVDVAASRCTPGRHPCGGSAAKALCSGR